MIKVLTKAHAVLKIYRRVLKLKGTEYEPSESIKMPGYRKWQRSGLENRRREIGIWVRIPGLAFNGVVTLIDKGAVC